MKNRVTKTFTKALTSTPNYTLPRILCFAILSVFLRTNLLPAQTCPYGSPAASTGYGVSASGSSAGASNATGVILAATSTLSAANSATTSLSIPLVIDLKKWVAQGSTLTIAWSFSSGTPVSNVSISNDNSTYTSLGSLSGSATTSSVYANFTVPAGGVRYIRITSTSGVSFIDGARYTHTCQFPVDAVNDTRVFMTPGTAKGNAGYNDLNYDNDSVKYSLASINVTNGTLTFNSSGAYTYKPNTNFDGVDFFSYRVCDAGPDGRLYTNGDNNCDTAMVTFRSLFTCDTTVFYMPLPENEAIDFLKDIKSTNGDTTQFYAGLSVTTDAIVVYDHWEDGFEADIKAPSQSTTQIWGDADLSNGIAPGFPTDILDAGKAIILSNKLISGHSGTTTYDPNATGSDATLLGVVDYDGKDKMFIGGLASLAKFAWGAAGTVSMTGTAVPSVKKWGTAYVLPVGQNTANGGTQFEMTSLSVIASENNTVVTIDRDANGTTDITVTLNQGETYYLDSRQGATIIAVNQGATINATKPVMVTLLTGDYQTTGTGYQGRTYSLIPNSQFSTCYYMPGVPQETMRVYLYNPTASSLTVTRTTAGGSSTTISVAAGSTAIDDINNSGLGYRYCAGSAFAIVTTVDYNSATSDWGFTPVPAANLTSKVLMSIGAGVDPFNSLYGTQNLEQALVTVDSTTYLYVDLDGDGMPDKVSFNSNVDALDAAVSIGGINYNETTSNTGILLASYQTITIGSTTGNLNGATFWTRKGANNTGGAGKNIILVWGQNGGAAAAPNIDAGYTVPNIASNLYNSVVKSADSICLGSNSDSIKIKYSGGTAPYKAFWFNERTNTYASLNTSKDSFSIRNLEPGTYLIKVKDAGCRTFSIRTTIYQRTTGCVLNVTGTIFNDANGKKDNLINGTATGVASATVLYVYLVNSAGTVIDSSKVNTNGTYSLTGVRSSTYRIRLSTTVEGIGAVAPAANVPTGWINTAEQFGTSNSAGTGTKTGTSTGIIDVAFTTGNISNVNFGIERLPNSDNKSRSISITPSSLYSTRKLISTTGLAGLRGSDAEDGTYVSGNRIVLKDTVGMRRNILFYDNNNNNVMDAGERLSPGDTIQSYDSTKLSVMFSGVNSTSFTFRYSNIDAAGFADPTPGVYSVSWLTPLPVALLKFDAVKSANDADISWTTSSEKNSSHFVLERSADGRSWMSIASVKARGNSDYPINYYSKDIETLQGTNFYRLKIYDLDSQFMYSTIRLVDFNTESSTTCRVYPNITTGSFNISTATQEKASYLIADVTGIQVRQGEFTGSAQVSGLQTGIYFVNIIIGNEIQTFKVIVTN